MPVSPVAIRRRSLLVAGLGAIAVGAAGCDVVDDLFGDAAGPSVSDGAAPDATAPDDDEALLAEVGTAIGAAGALAAAVAAAVPALAPLGRRLGRLHEAHARRLSWSGEVDRPAVEPGRKGARAQLLRAEADLQTTLTAAAGRAASGALAQTFASMAAAIAQQRAVLR